MKHHKDFRRALLVSIQERQAQYPEMTDTDLERALRTLADRSQRERGKRLKAEADARWAAIHAEIRAARAKPDPQIAERQRAAQQRAQSAQRQRAADMQEREAQRELSCRIADVGFKALAKEMHPDKGGSLEAMKRLNRARAHLKQVS
jgi:hypothetical protein